MDGIDDESHVLDISGYYGNNRQEIEADIEANRHQSSLVSAERKSKVADER